VFEDLGFEVVSSVGFSCANALHIAHLPEWAKEKAIMELLANKTNELDAVVQCGTNMSLINVSQILEPILGIPILGTNATTFWFALRANGFDNPLDGGGEIVARFLGTYRYF
jgi:maleate isomerase